MSSALVYANVGRRLRALDERMSMLEYKNSTNRNDWENIRRDLIAVTHIVNNLEGISNFPTSSNDFKCVP